MKHIISNKSRRKQARRQKAERHLNMKMSTARATKVGPNVDVCSAVQCFFRLSEFEFESSMDSE